MNSQGQRETHQRRRQLDWAHCAGSEILVKIIRQIAGWNIREIGLFLGPEDVYSELFVKHLLLQAGFLLPDVFRLKGGFPLEQRVRPLRNPEQRGVEFEFVGFLRLVDFDMLLHAAHHRASQMLEPDRLVGYLAQRDDRVLIVVSVQGQRCARGNFASALCREQHELETVRDLEDTVFDGNARHSNTLRQTRKSINIWSASGG